MIFANGLTGTIGRHLKSQVEKFEFNLSSAESEFSKLNLDSVSQFIHLAGVVGNNKVKEDLSHSYAVNVEGLIKLADKFYETTTGRFIYISSSHVYASSMSPVNENSKLDPINEYAEQKLLAEESLFKIFQNSPNRLLIIRVFSVLDFDVPDFTLGGAIRKIAVEDEPRNLENVDDVRDFMTPKNIANAIMEITKLTNAPQVLNLCTGKEMTVRQAAIEICNYYGVEMPRERMIAGNSKFPYIVGDNSLLRRLLPELQLNWLSE